MDPNDELMQNASQSPDMMQQIAFLQSLQGSPGVPTDQQNMPLIQQQAQALAPTPGSQVSIKQKMPMDQQLFQKLLAEKQKSEKQQEIGIGSLKKQLEEFRGNGQGNINYQPLLALADSWSGGNTNYAQGYKAPLSKDERKILEAKLGEEIQRRQNEFSNIKNQDIRDQLILQQFMAKAGKGKELPISEVEKISGAQTSQAGLEDLKNMIAGNQDLFGPGKGQMASIQGFFGVGDTGQKAASIKAQLSQIAQIIGKGLEGGKLTDQDILRYERMLPALGDNPNVIKDKLASLQRLIEQGRSSSVQNANRAGYNVSGFDSTMGNYPKPGVDMPLVNGRGSKAAQAPQGQYQEGQIATSKSGKKAVFKNGRWEAY